MARYRQYGFSPAYGNTEEMWSRLSSRLLMHLQKIKNWLALCIVNIFMMMAGTEWVVGGMGFAAISHYVPNIFLWWCVVSCYCFICFLNILLYPVTSTVFVKQQNIVRLGGWGGRQLFLCLKAFRWVLPWSVSFLLGTQGHFLVAAACTQKGEHCFYSLT